MRYSDSRVEGFRLGMRVEVEVANGPASVYKLIGKVVMTPGNMPSDADEETKRSVRISVAKIPKFVTLGTEAHLILLQDRKPNIIIIPNNLIHSLGGRKYVHILNKGLKKERDLAMGSSIPIYTTGIMQRMLTRDLEISQQTNGQFPGGYLIKYDGFTAEEYEGNNPALTRLREKISNVIAPSIGLPILTSANYLIAGSFQAERKDLGLNQGLIDLSALSDLKNHIKIIHGRMFSPQKTGGVYEVMVTEEAFQILDLTLDKTYRMYEPNLFGEDSTTKFEFQVKVVGIFSYRDENDPYWFYNLNAFGKSMLMDFDLLQGAFIQEAKININSEMWFFAYG